VIRLRPRPANDTAPLNRCDSCGDGGHDSSAHRDPARALGVAERHLRRHDDLVFESAKRADPDGSLARRIKHHLTMYEMWKRTAHALMAKARRKVEGT
jgi:hypothetical protein